LAGWGANSVLGFHFGVTDYLLRPEGGPSGGAEAQTYRTNESVWADLMGRNIMPGLPVVLKEFCILDWFPRAPGLYFTPGAGMARQEATQYLERSFPSRRNLYFAAPQSAVNDDQMLIFTPEGKFSMLQGGIGSIRLKPIQIADETCWLLTATSDGVIHRGVPVALPQKIYATLFREIRNQGATTATIMGKFQFVPSPFTRLFDTSIDIPKVVLKVEEVHLEQAKRVELEASVAVSFVSEYKGSPSVYATYVSFRPDIDESFKEALQWMKTEYVEGRYKGRIVTDFDQTTNRFPEARLALNKVMARLVSRNDLAETLELMQTTARIDDYFDEISVGDLLPKRPGTQRTSLFISYAHSDEARYGWVGRIRAHLQGLGRSLDLEVWDDSRIEPGSKWRNDIKSAIKNARAAVLVLTADFLNSDYIRDSELPLLIEAADAEGAAIFVIYGSPVLLSGAAERLASFQSVNDPKQPLLGMPEVERERVFVKLSSAVEKTF